MDNGVFPVVAALYPAEKYMERESSYPHYTAVLNLANIEFPMILKDISKFKWLNTVSINIYSIGNEQVFLLRLTEQEREAYLLYLQDSRNGSILRGSRTCRIS